MKNYIYLCIVAIIVFCCTNNPVKANNAAGGELIYEWISDSTYRFFFKFYRDCSGDTATATAPLCFKNPCASTGFTVTMNRWQGPFPGGGQDGNTVSSGCSQYKTTCDSPASNLPGFKEYWYSATVTLPARCNAWRIFTYINYRNASNNIQNATTKQMYLECRFNNTGTFQGNSSPYFSIKPIPYLLQNAPYSYNNGAIDPNGDSVVTEVVNPLTGVTSCTDSPYNAALNTMSPLLSIPSNPFQTNNTFTTNNSTGQMNFTAAQLGSNTLAIRVKEYRSGILIGWIMRDIDVVVLPNTTAIPILNGACGPVPIGGPINGSNLQGCVGQQLSFCFYAKSPDTNAILVVTDNHQFTIPNATITYYNQKNDSVSGTFMMTPTLADVGPKNFVITIKDSTCRPPGILLYYVFSTQIYIWPPVVAVKDTSICSGNAAYLNVSGGGSYQWAVLPGGASGSLSCTTCAAPIATPTTTTSYAVVSTINTFCNNNKDTVTVSVLPYYPPVKGWRDTTICIGESWQLFASGGGNNYAWTVLSGTQGSLSCNQCTDPFITPLVTTRYLLRSNVSICAGNTDTVTIGVLKRNKGIQTVQVKSNQNGYIINSTPTIFRAEVKECNSPAFTWKKNNVPVLIGVNGHTYTASGLVNGDIITCCMECNDPCPVVNYPVCNNYTVNNIITTSIHEINNNSGVSVYPNPNNGKFTVEIKGSLEQTQRIDIINPVGQLIHTETISINNGSFKKDISLNLPKGVYLLRINDKTHKFAVE